MSDVLEALGKFGRLCQLRKKKKKDDTQHNFLMKQPVLP